MKTHCFAIRRISNETRLLEEEENIHYVTDWDEYLFYVKLIAKQFVASLRKLVGSREHYSWLYKCKRERDEVTPSSCMRLIALLSSEFTK